MPEWIGKIIGNVRIDKLLARGGMAEVYLGSHLNLDRLVAIKLLHSYIEEEPLLLDRFQREAKVVAGLRHPNIVQIFDFDTVDGHPYIVMEYLKGPTLATYLRHLHQRKKRIPPDQVARLLNELAVALDYAHKQGVVHRDIKPGNIMLLNKSEDMALDKPLTNDVEAVITDFGLVRIMNSASQTASGTVSGTPAYMSPEQARGDPTDHRTDIYSLGIVLYEMLAGRVPFEADSTLTVLHMQIHTSPAPIPGIPGQVQAVLDRALLKNPEERYQTSRELVNDYYRAIGTTPREEIRQEPVVVRPVPVPVPDATEKLERVVVPEPTEKLEVQPRPEPKPQPIPELQSRSEPKPKPESKAEPLPPKPEPIAKLEPQPRPEPRPELEARDRRTGGRVLLFSVLGLLGLSVLGAAAFFLLRPQTPASPTGTVSPEIPNTSTGPSPTEAPVLPASTGMVPIPAGSYWVGKDPEGQYQSAAQNVSLDEYWIDQYQVTNSEYQQFVTAWTIPAGKENHPVMGVPWEQADAYCRSLNKKLPDESQWEVAGRGPGQDPPLFPWGTDATAEGNVLKLPNDTYDVGSQDFNVSPLQVYDMLYNVYEWVDAPYGSLEAGKKVLRGARYGNPVDLAFRVQVGPDDTNYVQYAGFRCAAEQVR